MNRVTMAICVVWSTLLVGVAPAAAVEDVPTFAEISGHEFGERITLHHEMIGYLEALAESSPRVSLIDQGTSWEGRRLLLAVVTSARNQGRLGEIRAVARQLDDPRLAASEGLDAVPPDQPAILFFGGSIHGFELSGSEGVLKLLEHLTRGSDAETLEALERTVILLDPMINPDGREAFARRNHAAIGREPNPERDDWSNSFTRWEALSFRTGHYFFDTNRDWWAQTQRETQGRAATIRAWRPQVIVDLHEMGADVEFYFDPATEPFGPWFPPHSHKWLGIFGQAYARAFDEAGFEYMTRERFNYFYPGYTTSWGSYQGAVGMLYEQGSSRGLALNRADESVRTLADALEQQFTAAWAAVRLASSDRDRLLSEYRAAQTAALENLGPGAARYLVEPSGDGGQLRELELLLGRNGIEVARLTEATELAEVRDRQGRVVGLKRFPAGTLVVEALQPRNHLVRALLEPDLPIADEFLEEARARIDRGENPRFYDITAWSLPLLFDLNGYSSGDRRALTVEPLTVEPLTVEPLTGTPPAADSSTVEAGYAYVLDGGRAAAVAALHNLHARGHRVAMTLEPTRIAGRDLSGGSVVARVGQNEATIHEAVRETAERYDLELVALDTGLSEPGLPALGSSQVVPFRGAEIALLAGQPVHGYSFGWTWFTLDRQFEIPVTVRQVESIARTPIDRFDVLIVPNLFSSEELGRRLGEQGLDRIRSWVKDGGTLVAMAEGVEFVRRELALGDLRSYYPDPPPGDTTEGSSGEESQPEPRRFAVPGAFLRVELQPDRWLGAGYDGELPVLVDSSRIYLDPEGPPAAGRRVVGRYGKGDDLHLAGHIWPESLERLGETVFAYEEKIGAGRIILFAEDLNYRAYWRGANRLFLNAVVLGPSAP